MRFARVLAFLCPVTAQTLYPISPANFQYFSYTYQAPNPPPAGAIYSLNFPNQAQGGQDVLAACSTYANLQYYFYNYSVSTGWSPTPNSGPLIRPPSNFEATTGGNPTLVQGLSFDLSVTGQIGSIASPSTQNFQQAWFWSADPCYLAGAEFGFYKLFQGTGMNNVINFYYALNGNCGGEVAGLTQCRSKVDGSNIFPNVAQITLTQPSGLNSLGRTDWLYQAYVISNTAFEVRIRDPGTLADAVTPQFVTVQSWFAATASAMYSGGLPGYVTVTQQRTSPAGGITDSMSNPSILTTYGVAAILTMITPPVTAATYGSLSGYCTQGGYSSTTGGVNSTTKVQTSYPSCTVTVYLTGTTTPATLYSTATGTPLANPFNANQYGYWNFYSANGTYDVQLSGGSPSIPLPFTLGNLAINSPGNAHTILAYPAAGVPGFVGVTDATATNSITFTAPSSFPSSLVYTLPSSIPAGGGCWQTSGSGVITIAACGGGGGGGGGGVTGSVQYLSGTSTITGDSNIIWNATGQQLTIAGIAATAGIVSQNGFIQSGGGFYSAYPGTGNYNAAMNSNGDGILVRAVQIASSTVAPLGGYLNISPLTYASNNPSPLPGIPGGIFPTNSALMWVAGLNTFTPASTAYSLNSNMSINAPNFIVCNYDPIGHVCLPSNYNSFQSTTGGFAGVNFTATKYIQVGEGSSPPCVAGGGCLNPMPTGDSPQAGAIYWDTGNLCFSGYNGSTWACIGGGSGSPGGSSGSIQINNGSGGFGGSSNFTYTTPSSHPLITIAASAGFAGLNVTGGYTQSAQGFYAASCTATNCLNIPSGGANATAFIATGYVQTGNQATNAPTLLATDTPHAGLMFYNTSSTGGGPCEMVYNGSTYVCLASASGGAPGSPSGSIQYNSGSSTFNGAAAIAMTSDAKNTVGGTYLTFASSSFPQATNNVSLVNSGGVFFILNNAAAKSLMDIDQNGNMIVGQVSGATGTVTTNANVYNAFTAAGSAGGFLGATFQAGSTAGNAFQCTTTCGATLTTLDVTGFGSLVIQALSGQIAGKDLYANDSAWNTIQAPSGGITGTVVSGTSFYSSGPIELGPSSSPPSGTNPYQWKLVNSATNYLALEDGSSNAAWTVDASAAPTYHMAIYGQLFVQGKVNTDILFYGQAASGSIADMINVTNNAGTATFHVTNTAGINVPGTATFGSAATFNGGVVINTGSGINSTIYIGTNGDLYTRTLSGAPGCTSGAPPTGTDGRLTYDPATNILWLCGAGTAHAH